MKALIYEDFWLSKRKSEQTITIHERGFGESRSRPIGIICNTEIDDVVAWLMAAKKETYDLIFRGVDKVTPEMRAIVASFEKLNTTVKKTGKDLDEAGKISALSDKFGNVSDAVDGSIGAFGRLGTTVAKTTLALSALAVGGLVYAASKAMELETSIVNLDKVLGDQERDQLPSLIKRTQEFADAYGFAGTEAIDSAANFRKAGFALEDALTRRQYFPVGVQLSP